MRIDDMPLQFLLEHRHSYPSRDDALRVQVHVLLQFFRGLYWRRQQVMFLAPLYALVVIRQMLQSLKKFIEDIDVYVTNSTNEVDGNSSSLNFLVIRDPQVRCMFSCSVQHALNTWVSS